jgi:hypothetical protein
MRTRSTTGAALALLAWLAAGCLGPGQAPPSGPATPVIGAVATSGAGAAAVPTAGLITSGTSAAPTEELPPVRPEAEVGVRRAVHVDEARRLLPFTPLEPRDLERTFNLDATQLIEDRPGETTPGLPQVRFVYQAEPSGALFITQGPATGEPLTGTPVDVAGHAGWITTTPLMTVTWEQDGVRIELRGRNLPREEVLRAANSMAPMGAPTAAP